MTSPSTAPDDEFDSLGEVAAELGRDEALARLRAVG